MLLFAQRMKLRDKFYEWADAERFGERTPEHFMVFLLSNGLINEEKTKKFIEKKPRGAVDHEQGTAKEETYCLE